MKEQHWKKLGLIYLPSGEVDWMRSHAAVPIAHHLKDDRFRIFFTARDLANRSHTSYVEIDLNDPSLILNMAENPVLTPGSLGEFDDSGAMASWLTKSGNELYLYYIGWNLGVTVPFRNSIGLAVGDDKLNFTRFASGPIVDRSTAEPHFTASCCVIKEKEIWRMWYVSCLGWRDMPGGPPQHRYHIKYAESDDGIRWRREGIVAIDFANDDEYAISRPCVIKTHLGWEMWYSYRGESYRIGYATSRDGVTWQRHDHLVRLEPSQNSWDSEMIAYPYVFEHGGKRYMLYNGNGYGLTGFGLATLPKYEIG